MKILLLGGWLGYRYEDRADPAVALARVLTSDVPIALADEEDSLEEYNKERYVAGANMRYDFSRYYSASLNYTFTHQESERIGDDYDDHRLLLTLSWEQEWLRW